jgi:hypothetical protein
MSYTNRYPGNCVRCGRRIAAGMGTLVLSGGSDWRVYCHDHVPGATTSTQSLPTPADEVVP